MPKLVLSDLTNLTNVTTAVNTINNNSEALEEAFDNTLSRDGSTPNHMLNELDMNSYPIINLPAPSQYHEPIRKQELDDLLGYIAAGSIPIDTGLIADGAITEEKLADGSVTTDKLADDAVTSDKIADNTITSDHITANAVTTTAIEDLAITTAKLADLSVTTAKLANLAVTEGKLATDAVTTSKIADGSITEAKIGFTIEVDSENVNHLPIETGGTTRALYDLLTDVFTNVKSFGAVGDGTTDDTAAIAAAIDALPLNGGIIFFPPGTFKVTDEIDVDKPLTVIGSGRGITQIRATALGANKSIFHSTFGRFVCNGITFRGPTSAAFVSAEGAIHVEGAQGARVEYTKITDIECYDFGEHGIRHTYCDFGHVERCYVHNVGYGAIEFLSCDTSYACNNLIDTVTPGASGDAYGIYFTMNTPATDDRCVGWICSGNTVYNIPIWEAYDTHGGTDGVFSNNIAINCALGVSLAHANSVYSPERITITGNVLQASGATTTNRGIGVAGGTTQNALDIVISNNVLIGFGYDSGAANDGAIFVQDTEQCVITNNIIKSSYAIAILLYGDNNSFVVSDNNIAGINNSETWSAGIRIEEPNQTGIISGNRINSSNETGIHIDDTNDSVHFGFNNIRTTGTEIVGGAFGGRGLMLNGEATIDLASIGDGNYDVVSITVDGAEIGDFVEISASAHVSGLTLTGVVQAADTVWALLLNNTGAGIDLGSTTFYAKVTKRT
jgi:hypothetical protein